MIESSLELEPDGTTEFTILGVDVNNKSTTVNAQYVAIATGDWVSLIYDDNGNTLTRTANPPNGETFTYHWDREKCDRTGSTLDGGAAGARRARLLRPQKWSQNRLVKVERSAGPTTEFVYNAFGERVKIIEDADGTPVERRFIHSGAEILQERDSSNVILRNYYPQGEERLDETGDPQYLYTRDHLGNIRELVKKSDGSVVGRWDYSPFGVREDLIGGAGSVECEFGFTGHFTHEDSELVLTHFRGYVPELGRWLSPDPIAEDGGINLYAYTHNNPLNLIDPNGLNPVHWLADQFVEVVGTNNADNFAHFVQGAGDHITMDATRKGRELLYGNDYTDPCHKAYKAGATTAMVAETATGVGGLAKGVARGGFRQAVGEAYKRGTSRNFSNVRKRLGYHGIVDKGEHVHHWAITQAGAKKWGVPDSVLNAPWNLKPLSPANHVLAHHGSLAQRIKHGVPGWAKVSGAGFGLAGANAIASPTSDCP